MCEVALPNKEILVVYQTEILDKLSDIIPQSSFISVQEAIYSGNVTALQERLNTLLKSSVSFYDTMFIQDGITNIIKYGVAFSGKNVEIVMS